MRNNLTFSSTCGNRGKVDDRPSPPSASGGSARESPRARHYSLQAEFDLLSQVAEAATAFLEEIVFEVDGLPRFCGHPGLIHELRSKLKQAGYYIE